MKAQGVRLFDVIGLGPFMVYYGYKSKEMPGGMRLAMVTAGIGTVLYNLDNYLEMRRKKEAQQ